MKYVVTLHGKNYEVEVEKGEAILVSVSDAAAVAAAPAAAPAAPVSAAPAAAPAATGGPVSGTRLDAPLPGTVVDIKVAPGTAVKKGETVIIIEAMKMENAVVAPCDGVVNNIVCTKGSDVNVGDLLLTVTGR